MRTALVTVTVLGIILISQVSARPEAAPAQARGRAGFQGYWMGIDPVDGGDARRSLIRRSDGKYSLAARDSMLTLCDSTDRGFASFDDGSVVSRTVMQSNSLIIECFNNGATVQLHLRFELVERGLMIETGGNVTILIFFVFALFRSSWPRAAFTADSAITRMDARPATTTRFECRITSSTRGSEHRV